MPVGWDDQAFLLWWRVPDVPRVQTVRATVWVPPAALAVVRCPWRLPVISEAVLLPPKVVLVVQRPSDVTLAVGLPAGSGLLRSPTNR